MLNVLDKLPKRLHAEMRKRLRALAEAPTRQECERRRDALCAWLRGRGQETAAACLERDWELRHEVARSERTRRLEDRPMPDA